MAMDRAQIERISKALGDKTRLQIFEGISARSDMKCQDIVAMRRSDAGDGFASHEDFAGCGADTLPPRRAVCLQ